MTARGELEKAMSRCKISRRRRSLHAQRAEKSEWCWETVRPRAAREANTIRMPETRSQKLRQGQRTGLRAGKEAEVQNTVMDDRRADPQRVKRA